MNRFKAAFIHFLISAGLAAIVVCLLMFGWFPLPYFWAIGGPLLLALIIGIDVVLGPLMTMILFNPGKSRRALTLDLSLIAIVQLSALGYGLHSGYVSRLVFHVFDGKSFQLVQAGDVAANFLQKASLPQFQQLPFASQTFAALQVPDDAQTRSDLTFFGALGVGPQFMPQYYVPLEQARAQLLKAAIPAAQISATHPALAKQIDTLLDSRGLNWQQVILVPFEVKTATYTAVVQSHPLQVIKVLAQSPR